MLLGMSLMALPAFCGAISMNQWYTFGWSGAPITDAINLGAGSAYTGYLGTPIAGLTCATSTPCFDTTDPWTFTGTATLVVQDLYFDGDRFNVLDFGSLIGTTSNPVNDGTFCGISPGNDPLGCSGNVKFSRGVFNLGAGAHSLTIQIIQETTNITSGQAVFQLVGAGVPEPTTWSMMGLGLGALVFGWRARRKA